MTLSFAALYGLSALSLFGLAILTGYLFEHGRSAWRRWRCKQEMEAATLKRQMDGLPRLAAMLRADPHYMRDLRRRNELENLATARDKAERKIH